MAVGMRHQFIRFLCRRIETDRMIDIVMDRERQMGVAAVDRTRGSKNQMTGLAMAAALEDVEKTGEISIEISVRILQRVTNAGLRREVHDRAEFALAKNAFDVAPRGEIDLMEAEFVVFAQNGEPGFL